MTLTCDNDSIKMVVNIDGVDTPACVPRSDYKGKWLYYLGYYLSVLMGAGFVIYTMKSLVDLITTPSTQATHL